MKSKLWKKPLTGKKVLLIILLLAVVGLISFITSISIFCMLNHNNDNQEKCEKCEKCEECKKCPEDNDECQSTIYASVNKYKNLLFPSICTDIYPYSTDFINKFYGSGIKIEEFSKDDLITSAVYNIENVPVCSKNKATITLHTINAALEESFNLKNLKITEDDLKKYKGHVVFEFDGDEIYISSGNCDGCGPGLHPSYSKK